MRRLIRKLARRHESRVTEAATQGQEQEVRLLFRVVTENRERRETDGRLLFQEIARRRPEDGTSTTQVGGEAASLAAATVSAPASGKKRARVRRPRVQVPALRLHFPHFRFLPALHVPRLGFTRRRLSLAGALVLALAVATGGIAYWTTGGSGTAGASVGSLNAPTNVSASTTPGSGTVPVSWTGITAPNGGAPDGYYVERFGSHPGPACMTSPTSLTTNTNCIDLGLSDGTYTYKVTAVFRSWTAQSGSSNSVTVVNDNTPPTVSSINRVGTSPTNATSVQWTVTFSENVTGVDAGDFALAGTGVSGASITSVTGSNSSYTVTSSTGPDGTLGLNLVDNDSITDGVGNTLGGGGTGNGNFTGQVYTVDKSAPTATITLQAGSDSGTSNSDNITNATSLVFSVSFNEAVTGLATSDFSNAGSATGCNFSSLTGTGPYTLTVTSCSAGTAIARLATNGVTDTAGNGNAQTDSATVTIDRTAPTVTITLQAGSDAGTSNSDNITNATSLTFDVNFSEAVAGLAGTDFSNPGSATGCSFGAPANGPTNYTETLTSCSAGTVILRLAASGVTDTAGNANAQTSSPTVTIDRTAPTATITLQAGSDSGTSNSDNITNATILTFAVNFSESVAGLAAADFSNAGTATGCTFGAPAGGPTNYTVTVTGCSEGTVIVRLAAAGVTDTAGNGNAQTNGATVTVDRTAPTATITLQAGSDSGTSNSDNITNATSLVFSVSFNEAVTGLATSDFSNAGSATGCNFSSLTGTGPYTLTVTSCSAGTAIARLATNGVTDTAGNGNAQTDSATVTIDRTAPTVTITLQAGSDAGTSNSDNITNATSLTFDVNFSEAVAGLAGTDFSNPGSATGCSFGAPANGPTNYTETLTSCSAGTVILRLAASGVTDTAGNANAQTSSPTVTIDRTAPTATITLQAGSDSGTSNSDNITNATILTFAVNFSESVAGLAAADFSNAGTATGCTFGAPAGGPTNYTVTVTGCSEGTVIVRLAAAGVTDTAGNGNAQTNGATVTVDRTAPTASFTFPVNGASYPNSTWTSLGRGTWSGSAADPGGSGLASIQLSGRRSSDGMCIKSNNGKWQINCATLDDGLFSIATAASWSYSGIDPPGAGTTVSAEIQVADIAGNATTIASSFTVT